MKDKDAICGIIQEYNRAVTLYGPFNSSHEGYAVILEELDELWEIIKKKESLREVSSMQQEAIQIGAMALRFLVDIC